MQERFNDETPGCMTVSEAAGEFEVSQRTLRRRIQEGTIQGLFKVPKRGPGGTQVAYSIPIAWLEKNYTLRSEVAREEGSRLINELRRLRTEVRAQRVELEEFKREIRSWGTVSSA